MRSPNWYDFVSDNLSHKHTRCTRTDTQHSDNTRARTVTHTSIEQATNSNQVGGSRPSSKPESNNDWTTAHLCPEQSGLWPKAGVCFLTMEVVHTRNNHHHQHRQRRQRGEPVLRRQQAPVLLFRGLRMSTYPSQVPT